MDAMLIDLDRLRRARGEPSIASACVLVHRFIEELDLAPVVAQHISSGLDFILLAVSDGNIDAIRSWRRIERELRAPLRASEHGEHPRQAWIDRIVFVEAHTLHSRRMMQRASH
jgi:hypothetical protein